MLLGGAETTLNLHDGFDRVAHLQVRLLSAQVRRNLIPARSRGILAMNVSRPRSDLPALVIEAFTTAVLTALREGAQIRSLSDRQFLATGAAADRLGHDPTQPRAAGRNVAGARGRNGRPTRRALSACRCLAIGGNRRGCRGGVRQYDCRSGEDDAQRHALPLYAVTADRFAKHRVGARAGGSSVIGHDLRFGARTAANRSVSADSDDELTPRAWRLTRCRRSCTPPSRRRAAVRLDFGLANNQSGKKPRTKSRGFSLETVLPGELVFGSPVGEPTDECRAQGRGSAVCVLGRNFARKTAHSRSGQPWRRAASLAASGPVSSADPSPSTPGCS